MGGRCKPGVPRRRFANDCWCEVNSRFASASVSATTMFTPAIAYGFCSCADGLNNWRYSAIACVSASGAKCDANAYGRPSAAASCAP